MPLTKCKAESLDLTANYTFTGDVTLASGGSLNLISTQTASGVSSIEFTTGIDSTYDEYWFVLNNIHPSSEGTNYVSFQASTNSGSSYGVTMTSTYFVTYHSEDNTYTALSYQSGSDLAQSTSEQTFNIYGAGADNDQSCSGILKLYNPSSTTYVKHFISSSNNYVDSAIVYSTNDYVAGYFNTTSAINAIRFQMSSGNIDDGIISLYGVKKS